MKNIFFVILILNVFTVCALSQTPTPTASPGSGDRPRPNSDFVLSDKDVIALTSENQIPAAGIINGKAIRLVAPSYPPAAKTARASGTVNVAVVLDEEGNVVSASAISGHPLLQEAAEEAARVSKFSPTLMAGKPVKVRGIIVYNFVMNAGMNSPVATFESGSPATTFGVRNNPAINPNIAATNWIRWSMLLVFIGREQEPAINSASLSLANALPNNLVSEKELLRKIPVEPQNRAQIISDIYNLLPAKVKASETWQIELGRALGEINHQVRTAIFEESFPFDSENVRKNLLKIKELSKTVPPDFPVDLSEPLNKFAVFAETKDLNNPATLIALMRNFQKTYHKLSLENLR